MIIREYYETRQDGVKLYRTCSNEGKMLLQSDTGIEYAEAIDVEDSPHTYVETATPVPDGEYLQAQDALNVVFGEGVESP